MASGEENGKRGYILTFVITYIRDFTATFRFLTESFETSCPWNKVSSLCKGVIRVLHEESRKFGLTSDKVFATNRVT